MTKKKLIVTIILCVITIVTLFIGSVYELKSLSIIKPYTILMDGKYTATIFIKNVNNESITLDTYFNFANSDLDSITISSIDMLSFSQSKPGKSSTPFQVVDSERINISDNMYNGSKFVIKDIKINLPSKSYLYPFMNYNVNLLIYPRNDGKLLKLKQIKILDYNKWLSIRNFDKGFAYKIDSRINSQYSKEIEYVANNFANSFYLELGYPFTYRLLIIVLLLGISILIFIITIKIIKLKSPENNLIGLIIAFIIGLPGINNILKMGIIDSLTLIDLFTVVMIIWLVCITILYVYKSLKLKKD